MPMRFVSPQGENRKGAESTGDGCGEGDENVDFNVPRSFVQSHLGGAVMLVGDVCQATRHWSYSPYRATCGVNGTEPPSKQCAM